MNKLYFLTLIPILLTTPSLPSAPSSLTPKQDNCIYDAMVNVTTNIITRMTLHTGETAQEMIDNATATVESCFR